MLVLSRKPGEAIVFPDLGITVSISRLRGKNVTLAVEAPREVHVLREELVPRVDQFQSDAQKDASNSRCKLHSIRVLLNVMQAQADAGGEVDTRILKQVIDQLLDLDESLTVMPEDVSAPSKDRLLATRVEDDHQKATRLSAYLSD